MYENLGRPTLPVCIHSQRTQVVKSMLQNIGRDVLSHLFPDLGRELDPFLLVQPLVDSSEIEQRLPRYVNKNRYDERIVDKSDLLTSRGKTLTSAWILGCPLSKCGLSWSGCSWAALNGFRIPWSFLFFVLLVTSTPFSS